MPCQRQGSKPGPVVTAKRSMSGKSDILVLDVGLLLPTSFLKRSGRFFWCSRLARLGTTPPNGRWVSIWEAVKSFLILNFGELNPPFASIIASEVSSQEVSIDRIFIDICSLRSRILLASLIKFIEVCYFMVAEFYCLAQ